jgi:hypothetical protein
MNKEDYQKIYHCPNCNEHGKWRHGMHFEHEMICFDCSEIWEPELVEREILYNNNKLIQQQENNNGEGI